MNKWLLAILVLAAVLKLWGLSNNPPHLTNDEAALGYNAYSILKTARDEHGEFLPIVFKSFGDWKPGLYVYLTVPSVALFGLNEFAVRLPSALFGILAVFLMYLVVGELFRGTKLETGNWRLATVASFLLAISPWHLQFSRGAWEAGVSLTLVLAGVYTFLRAVRDRPSWLALSAVLFALTLWTYQGAKLSASIAVVILTLVHRKELLKIPRKLLAKSIFVGLIVATPILLSLAQGKTGRLEVYSIFSYERPEETVQEILGQEGITRDTWRYRLYHSEPLNFTRGILGRWLNHYSGRFLFFEGDWSNPRHGVPNAGVILLLDALFLIAGFAALSRLGKSKASLFIWLWLLLAPLPAALSRDSVHAVRTLNMVVPLTVVLALGATSLVKFVKLDKLVLLVLFVAAYAANYVYYLDQYWVHAPAKNSQYWQYGYRQMVEKVSTLQDEYDEIVVKQSFEQPYIFFLFYMQSSSAYMQSSSAYQKYDPAKYQQVSREVYIPNEFGDVGLVSKFENVTFRDINWQDDRGMSGKLFIVDPIKVPIEDSSNPDEFNIIHEIKYLNGETAFRFVEIK